MLLSRPLIQKIRVITSTLHQLIKFMYKGKTVVIHAKEYAIDLYQVDQRFWIPYDLVGDE